MVMEFKGRQTRRQYRWLGHRMLFASNASSTKATANQGAEDGIVLRPPRELGVYYYAIELA